MLYYFLLIIHTWLCRALLKVSTNLSVWPLLLGVYATVVTCSIAKTSQNFLNSPAVNWLTLSEMISSGKPYLANSSCKKFTVTVEVGFLHFKISGHLLKLSTTTKLWDPLGGPAKSICNLDHGASDFGYEFDFIESYFATRAQHLQFLAVFSMS